MAGQGTARARSRASVPASAGRGDGDGHGHGCGHGCGNVLYTTMVFWLVGLLAPALPTRSAALAFCFAIEISQLYPAPWIDAIRDTRLGGLVLGHGFHATDLVCYGIGVLLGVLIERAWLLRV